MIHGRSTTGPSVTLAAAMLVAGLMMSSSVTGEVLLGADIATDADIATGADIVTGTDNPLSVAVVEQKPAASRASKPRPPVDAAKEKAALDFAHEHHPELVRLLRSLKEMEPREYAKAIADISRVSERLARTQNRSPERHKLDLAVWKLDSRIHLLAARMATGQADGQQKELETLLQQRLDARLAVLEHDRQRQQQRLESLNENIRNLKERREATIARELSRLVRHEKPKNVRAKNEKRTND